MIYALGAALCTQQGRTVRLQRHALPRVHTCVRPLAANASATCSSLIAVCAPGAGRELTQPSFRYDRASQRGVRFTGVRLEYVLRRRRRGGAGAYKIQSSELPAKRHHAIAAGAIMLAVFDGL